MLPLNYNNIRNTCTSYTSYIVRNIHQKLSKQKLPLKGFVEYFYERTLGRYYDMYLPVS